MGCTALSCRMRGVTGTISGDAKMLLGCTLQKLSRHRDERGWLVPVWDSSNIDAKYMYYSWTYPGQCRDEDRWHLHHIQTDHFVVLHGNLLVALSDGESVVKVAMSGRNPQILTIPPGIYHCFKNYWHRDSLLCNLPDAVYNPDDEGRVPFVELGVEQPW
jgi:dTDP-4-dehydrorhamnose 3,5-epimerase